MSTKPDQPVFLSFRGPDTRRNFADFLYTGLDDVGIGVFKDDKELEVGKEINSQLIQAIQHSKISIPVISEDYASSNSCLMELHQMVKRMDEKSLTIIPIFYYVEPKEVRACKGPFEKALNKHKEGGIDDSVLNTWKYALQRIAGLKGHHLQEKIEVDNSQVVKLIVRTVEQKLKTRDLTVPEEIVGVDPHVQEIMAKLKVDYRNGQAVKIGDTCEMVLIHGIPGVGKTVLAKCVYNKLNHLFDARSFLEKFQEEIRDRGIVSVQNRLISHLHKGNVEEFDCPDFALTHIQTRFRTMKVLLLLDDVKDHKQLSKSVGKLDWLGPWSRVIVTSRNKDVLQDVNCAESYFLGTMKPDDALTLFCKHAFGMDSPLKKFEVLAKDIVATTSRLPLALMEVGEYLSRQRKKKAWKEKLTELKEALDESVQAALEKSYAALDENAKKIFLDIACFFNEKDNRIPLYMWEECKFLPHKSILSLQAMSLVEIREDQKLFMHGILKTLGRQIVENESKEEPRWRSRLCNHEEALDVLRRGKGTGKVEALALDFADKSEGNISFECDKFDGLQNLRFLKLDRANVQGNFGDLLLRLRWLDWQGCLTTIEDHLNLNLQNLVILDLSCSQVHKDWRGWNLLVEARNLKVLKLTGCVQLTATPEFPASMALERLILEGCSGLAVTDQSFRILEKLVYLNLKQCSLLRELSDLGPMGGLKELVIDGTSITRINFQEGSMRNLKTLSARDCKDLTEISHSIRYLESLKYLSLDGSEIDTLEESIGSLKQLKTLSLKNCLRLTHLPDGIGRLTSLQFLDLSGTAIQELPTSIEDLKALKVLR